MRGRNEDYKLRDGCSLAGLLRPNLLNYISNFNSDETSSKIYCSTLRHGAVLTQLSFNVSRIKWTI